jgi:hypothetical protein
MYSFLGLFITNLLSSYFSKSSESRAIYILLYLLIKQTLFVFLPIFAYFRIHDNIISLKYWRIQVVNITPNICLYFGAIWYTSPIRINHLVFWRKGSKSWYHFKKSNLKKMYFLQGYVRLMTDFAITIFLLRY